tara:strand:+ start:1715 stop:1897 length:183 start_codon:yes stop_codon:yes gene_type:complete
MGKYNWKNNDSAQVMITSTAKAIVEEWADREFRTVKGQLLKLIFNNAPEDIRKKYETKQC